MAFSDGHSAFEISDTDVKINEFVDFDLLTNPQLDNQQEQTDNQEFPQSPYQTGLPHFPPNAALQVQSVEFQADISGISGFTHLGNQQEQTGNQEFPQNPYQTDLQDFPPNVIHQPLSEQRNALV